MGRLDEKQPAPSTSPETVVPAASSSVTAEQTAPNLRSPQLDTNTAGERPAPLHSLRSEIRVWTRDLLIAIGLALVIIVFLYQPVKVEGTSMAPSLSDQERIFINKFVYHVGDIGRGDVVVFWYPLDRTKSFIKRVVGLPGDLIEIRQGHVFINGKPLQEPYVPAEYMDISDYAPMRVRPGEYFVMGDHRISSNDSRMFGPVAASYIYGKAVFAYWPVAQFGSISAAGVKGLQQAPAN
jgi:signal peptidase I